MQKFAGQPFEKEMSMIAKEFLPRRWNKIIEADRIARIAMAKTCS
jgi:hypothetical protein